MNFKKGDLVRHKNCYEKYGKVIKSPSAFNPDCVEVKFEMFEEAINIVRASNLELVKLPSKKKKALKAI